MEDSNSVKEDEEQDKTRKELTLIAQKAVKCYDVYVINYKHDISSATLFYEFVATTPTHSQNYTNTA